MAIPRASRALARFIVLDLTRVRSGPACVRQLADWGANVIKIEMPPSVAGDESMGGPREGGDFQNLHRNKRRYDAGSEIEGRPCSIPEDGQEGRRHRRELPPRRLAAAEDRLQ